MRVDACDSADDAPDVHVEGRDPVPNAVAAIARAVYATDARQCVELFNRAWDLAVVLVPDTSGCLAECQRAAVVPEAGPCREQIDASMRAPGDPASARRS